MIAEALASYANATARVFEDRAQSVGASEVGQCGRRIFWLKNEDDPAHSAPRDSDYEDTWGARTRGSVFEAHFWEPALRRRFGNNLLYAGADQQTLTSEFLSATPDGLLIDLPRDALAALGIADIGPDRSLLVECKTSDPRAAFDAVKPEHAFQAQCQLGLIRELTKHRPDYALISYSDASFWNEGREFAVGFDETIFHQREDTRALDHDSNRGRGASTRRMDRRRSRMPLLPIYQALWPPASRCAASNSQQA
jgi:hypothetical protein